MPDSSHKQIIDTVVTRIKQMTIANGYAHDYGAVSAKVTSNFGSAPDLPSVHVWIDDEESVRTAYGTEQHVLALVVEAFDATEDDDFSIAAAQLAADIVASIHRAPAAPLFTDPQNINLGGIVTELSRSRYSYAVGEGQAPWLHIAIVFTVKYSSPIGDMYTLEA